MGELLLCTNEKIGPTLSAEMVAALDRGGGGAGAAFATGGERTRLTLKGNARHSVNRWEKNPPLTLVPTRTPPERGSSSNANNSSCCFPFPKSYWIPKSMGGGGGKW